MKKGRPQAALFHYSVCEHMLIYWVWITFLVTCQFWLIPCSLIR